MAHATTRDGLTERARDDPYASMEREDIELIADTFDIITKDADESEMSFVERNIGLKKSILCVTDYGRHRNACESMEEFEEFIREEIRDSFPSQYLKIMDDDKEQVADTLVAVSRSNGYVVVPHFE